MHGRFHVTQSTKGLKKKKKKIGGGKKGKRDIQQRKTSARSPFGKIDDPSRRTARSISKDGKRLVKDRRGR